MWEGYLSLGGIELINAPRSQAYARTFGLTWLRDVYNENYLPLILGDGVRYRTPLLDDAPWVDPDVPASQEFLGFHPLGAEGFEDSSRESTITEYISDGGSAGRLRHATKSLVVSGVLLALTEAGAEYGMRWLRSATLGSPCGPSGLFGEELCYLSSEPQLDIPDTPATLALLDGGTSSLFGGPELDAGSADYIYDYDFDGGDAAHTGGVLTEDIAIFTVDGVTFTPQDCLTGYLRHMRKVAVVSGPSITQKYAPTRGALWGVQFTMVAGDPSEYGDDIEIITGFLGGDPTGIATGVDSFGTVVEETECPATVPVPLNDPLCPVLVPPPEPPGVGLGCQPLPANWLRRQFSIPASVVPLWTDALPLLTIHAPAQQDLRMLRLRFYVDPFELADPSADPCGFCGDMVVSYLPADCVMTIDCAQQAIYVSSPGGIRQRADGVVYATDGTPVDWPALSCGSAYVVTVDLPQITELPVIDLALTPRAR